MTDPTPAALLDAWERSTGQPAGRRAVALLETTISDDVGAWSVGARDTALLTLRERLFGGSVAAVVGCPCCGERQELAFAVADIRAPRTDPRPAPELSVDGHPVAFRLPTGADLDAVAGERDVDRAARRLLDRCLVGPTCGAEELPEPVVAAIVGWMAEVDPQADIRLALDCDRCDHTWSAPFDIAAFLWAEVDAWAWRLLSEVDRLSRVYGWSETDVLALPPRRRQIYLELASR